MVVYFSKKQAIYIKITVANTWWQGIKAINRYRTLYHNFMFDADNAHQINGFKGKYILWANTNQKVWNRNTLNDKYI